MIDHITEDSGTHAELPSHANSAEQQTSSGQIENVEALRSMRPARIAATRAPKFIGIMADAPALQAHVERRKKLAAQIRLENPSRTEEEIEARLEQFGA
jgi:hypothetical protein